MTTRAMSLQRSEVVSEAIKSTPAVVVAAPAMFGMSVNDLLAVITIFYVLIQIGYLVHKWYRMSRRPIGRDEEE